ncbi:MAG: SDR family oxidoreductase [Burkholderiaceae bacterium]|nr:SDR family oxidoreductase [Burkholderiaceae bacterium]
MDLSGQTALVTGAGRGIGREIAIELGKHGADVILAARSVTEMKAVAEEIRSMGRKAWDFKMDLSNSGEIKAALQQMASKCPRIDILVNNSGIGGPTQALVNVDENEWRRTLDVNLTGAYLVTKEVLPKMQESLSGKIVFIGSVTGKRPLLNRTPYAASKLGLLGMVRTLAVEAGEFNVNVNLVSPGAVMGDRLDWVIKHQAEARAISEEEIVAQMEKTAALRRMVSARDIALGVVFLVSDYASNITGIDLNINAGTVMY